MSKNDKVKQGSHQFGQILTEEKYLKPLI